MNFPSIDIQGSIIASDLLGKIRSEQANFQLGKDFNKDYTNAKLKDEISSAWQDAKGQWTIFQNKLSRLKDDEPGTTETRNFWIVPLLTNIGYNLSYTRQPEVLNGKSFSIGYRDTNIDGFPVYIGGFHESLDKRPENKHLPVSPHAMVQEYLNYSEHLYGLVTNGKQLRLLRDASRITRLSYVEFNLQKMMEEDLYSDFVLFYRLLHVSRMPHTMDGGAESIIEKYHQEGLVAGSTIRSKLGSAVKNTIKALANGFLNHPDNTILRSAMHDGKLNTDDYYHLQLRIIYRLLFLFVIEERNLVFAESKTPETKRFNQIYFKYYSLLRLRKLAKKLPPPDSNRHYDLWQSLLSTFSLFEKTEIGEKMGIMALHGDIFSYDSIATSAYDLHQCKLSNAVILKLLKGLGYFENEQGILIAVNYGGLDVEEFGSVYEGLLELKLKIDPIPGTESWSVDFDKSVERGKSGSHYTPEELVQPLIKHSLEYLIEDRTKPYQQKKVTTESTIESLLGLKICDVACGSGHILLSAARRIALEIARIKTGEDQPNPMAVRKATKQVVKKCIYGVDKNPLAVELCKVALWLEAHNPGETLSFLDHHIKCGDAIVGLAHRDELENGIADEAFKTLPSDDKDIAKAYRDQNTFERKQRAKEAIQVKADFEKNTESSVQESMVEYKAFNHLPESTPEEIGQKAKAYRKFIDGKGYAFLKSMADTQIAQFFISKTTVNKVYLMTDADFRLIISGNKGWQDRRVSMASVVSIEQRFFHWFLEFPEVFNEGGFDCILGNPPYLGGVKISSSFGNSYLNFVKTNYFPALSQADLVSYFIRRIYSLIKKDAFFSLITTNSISQGDTRAASLDIIANTGSINFAIRSIRWPGTAALDVSLFSVIKGKLHFKAYLDGKMVDRISPYFDNSDSDLQPSSLFIHRDKSFKGVDLLGEGFLLEIDEGLSLMQENLKYSEIIKLFINGEDINTSPLQEPSRYVIDFNDMSLEQARTYEKPFSIISEKVFPERKVHLNSAARKYWWQFYRPSPKLRRETKENPRILLLSQTSKFLTPVFVPNKLLPSKALVVFKDFSFAFYAIIQSTIHNEWAFKYGSTLSNTLRYSASDIFETYPFPQKLSISIPIKHEALGEQYYNHRQKLMFNTQLGLTKIYNSFHAPEIQAGITSASLLESNKKTIEKHFGQEVLNLWNHLQKTSGTCSIEEAITGILKLRELHIQMDSAVLEAYGWQDVALCHDFYEVEYLPENDRVRYTIHPDARKEILKRLLDLNHKIHAEEVAAGLWDKKTTKAKPYKLESSESNQLREEGPGYGDLFTANEE